MYRCESGLFHGAESAHSARNHAACNRWTQNCAIGNPSLLFSTSLHAQNVNWEIPRSRLLSGSTLDPSLRSGFRCRIRRPQRAQLYKSFLLVELSFYLRASVFEMINSTQLPPDSLRRAFLFTSQVKYPQSQSTARNQFQISQLCERSCGPYSEMNRPLGAKY